MLYNGECGFIKVVSCVVVFTLLYAVLIPVDIIQAANSGKVVNEKVRQSKGTDDSGYSKKLRKALDDLDEFLTDVGSGNEATKSELAHFKNDIKTIDKEIRKEFDNTQKKLKGGGVSGNILKR
ncbi:MAG: hypothetical protein L3V56_10750, partial [Candidatus Magnetoovum sp. WYHC-5]|nr:hypothetical protein [Candidatus Magnetoovum sp. WYHC-5]